MTQAQQLANLSQAYTAGALSFRNRIINGNFDLWQRGYGPLGGGYLADRWVVAIDSGTNLQQSLYSLTGAERSIVGLNTWTALNVASDNVSRERITQAIENIKTLQDTYATLSFWAWTDTGNNRLSADVFQYFGNGGSPAASVATPFSLTPNTVGTTPTFVTGTVYIPSIAGLSLGTSGDHWIAPRIYKEAIGSNNALRIARVQFEPGTIVTPFELRPIGLELALCQRYYEIGNILTASYQADPSNGGAISTPVYYKVTKRVSPSIIFYRSGQAGVITSAATRLAFGSNPVDSFCAMYTTSGAGGSNSSESYSANAEF